MSGSTLNGIKSELIAAILAGDTELYHQLIVLMSGSSTLYSFLLEK